MAGTWRLAIESVEGLGRSSFLDVAKHALQALNRRESAGYEEDDAVLKQILVEVGNPSEPGNVCRTKSFDVPDDGNVRVNRVLFVPAPAPGTGLTIRVIQAKKSDKHWIVGEGQILEAAGGMEVDIVKKGRTRAIVRLNVTSGLPTAPSASEANSLHDSYLPDVRMDTSEAVTPMARAPHLHQSPGWEVASAACGSSPARLPRPLSEPAMDSHRRPSFQGATPTSTGAAIAAAAAASARAAAARSGRVPLGKRPLRMRRPGLPNNGTCDVDITEVKGLTGLHRPYIVVRLQGHEFRAEDIDGRGNPAVRGAPQRFQFVIASLTENLEIYVYQDIQGPHCAAGRILVPLTDVLWPVGEAPGLWRFIAGFERQEQEKPYRKQYHLQFLPPSEWGDGSGDATFLDCYGPASVDSARKFAFGSVKLELEVALRCELQPLIQFYGCSVLEHALRAARLGEGGPSCCRGQPRYGRPARVAAELEGEASAAEALVWSADFRSVLRSLERLRHGMARPVAGLPRWIRASPMNAYGAAACWFIFCFFGFFPCSLWKTPIYAWLLLVVNGLLAASQRLQDWDSREAGVKPLFWRDEALAEGAVAADGHDIEVGHHTKAATNSFVSRCRRSLYDAEPLLLTEAGFWERLRNVLSFADGAASAACFSGLGVLAAALSLSLFLVTTFDPGLSLVCGVYGAIGLLTFSRSGAGPRRESLWWQWAFNEALACVPDDALMVHRYVATRLQRVDM